jgi:hypothetical protein
MDLVIIESPYAGATPEETAQNAHYARVCMLDALRRGEAPFASHLLYTQMLDDRVRDDRALGIEAGLAVGRVFQYRVVYNDFGISPGMKKGIQAAIDLGQILRERSLMHHRLTRGDVQIDWVEAVLARVTARHQGGFKP